MKMKEPLDWIIKKSGHELMILLTDKTQKRLQHLDIGQNKKQPLEFRNMQENQPTPPRSIYSVYVPDQVHIVIYMVQLDQKPSEVEAESLTMVTGQIAFTIT